jgi:hypothetical protein
MGITKESEVADTEGSTATTQKSSKRPDFGGNTVPVVLMTAKQMSVGVQKFKLACMITYLSV